MGVSGRCFCYYSEAFVYRSYIKHTICKGEISPLMLSLFFLLSQHPNNSPSHSSRQLQHPICCRERERRRREGDSSYWNEIQMKPWHKQLFHQSTVYFSFRTWKVTTVMFHVQLIFVKWKMHNYSNRSKVFHLTPSLPTTPSDILLQRKSPVLSVSMHRAHLLVGDVVLGATYRFMGDSKRASRTVARWHRLLKGQYQMV